MTYAKPDQDAPGAVRRTDMMIFYPAIQMDSGPISSFPAACPPVPLKNRADSALKEQFLDYSKKSGLLLRPLQSEM